MIYLFIYSFIHSLTNQLIEYFDTDFTGDSR